MTVAVHPEHLYLAVAARMRQQREQNDPWDGPNGTARPNQLPPPGDWQTWLILAGRGFGKTRSGAEWVRKRMQRGDARHIILAGPTAADVRDIMVEGESGLVAVCERVGISLTYNPSKRRITFGNGATAVLVSADEPRRFRGLQSDTFWCLTGDTLVTMADGSTIPLSDVRAGDRVMTTIGPKTVLAQALTKRNANVLRLQTLGGRAIIGTADHPVWVDGRGYVPLSLVQPGDVLWHLSTSSSRGGDTTAQAAATMSQPSGSIGKSGWPLMARFRRAITSITSTATRATTGSKTSRSCRTLTIPPTTTTGTCVRIWTRRTRTARNQTSGTGRFAYSAISCVLSVAACITVLPSTTRGSARLNVWSKPVQRALQVRTVFANTVASRITRLGERSGIAHAPATAARPQHDHEPHNRGLSLATIAEPHLSPSDGTRDSAADLAPWHITTSTVESVRRLPNTADVFDIAVEDAHHFFANGILVHNCDELASWRYPEAWDMLMLGHRLGDDPRGIVTTTPRPIPIVKDLLVDASTVVTRGSTYENRDNLAGRFLDQVVKRYEGTTLGRQELYAEVLEDVEGALWTRRLIDTGRVRPDDVPALAQVVVAVDPATTHGEDSDKTGIAVAGRGTNGAYYVLHISGHRVSPNAWANKALDLYEAHEANEIVAEANQGGEMVHHTITTAARDRGMRLPRVRLIHASRGKQVRAEPVVALYEQGHVHHVGQFASAEDEMAVFPVGGDTDDEVDALVHAVTAVDNRPKRGFGVA